MKMLPFKNTKKHVVTLGTRSIAPGETREIPEIDHPDFRREKQAAAPTPDFIVELASKSVKAIIGELSTLTDGELAQLDTLEHDKVEADQRKTLTEAIAKEQLERARAASEMEQFAESLKLMALDELGEQAELHADDDQLRGLIEAEIERRPLGDGE